MGVAAEARSDSIFAGEYPSFESFFGDEEKDECAEEDEHPSAQQVERVEHGLIAPLVAYEY